MNAEEISHPARPGRRVRATVRWRTVHGTNVASRIEEAILSGELAPGDYMPSELEISAQMDVSRSVVREALGRLASLGLVRSVHGSGTRVEEPSSRPVTV